MATACAGIYPSEYSRTPTPVDAHTRTSHALTGEAFWSTHVVSIGISLATMALILWRTTTAASQVTAVAVSALLCNAYIDFSTSGLENPLAHLLIVTFFLYATREGRAACPGVLALFLSLFILTRHDLLLIALPPALCSVNWRAIDRRAALRVAIGLAPLALWELFSVVYYGFPVPNTAYAKLGGGVPKATSLSMGINYIVASFVYDPLCLVALATGVLAAIAGGDLGRRAFAVAAMAYIAYIVWAGGDFMAGRFLTAPFLISLLLVAERIARVPTAFGAVPGRSRAP